MTVALAMGPITQCVDDFVAHQGLVNGDVRQGMATSDHVWQGVLTHPSDEETVTMETNSVGLEELDETQD
jgi:hypothetical protein